MTPAQLKALQEYQDSVKGYTAPGPAKYVDKGGMQTEQQAPSEMGGVNTDPQYKQYELGALKSLEDQSRHGLTAQDQADMARVEGDANRQNRGRIGAIQQGMQARGMTGSGMDLVSQMASAQDSNDQAALAALEHEGMAQSRKNQATTQLGQMGQSMQGQDFSQAAAKAQAQDAINRFNTANSNSAGQWNAANTQQVANSNTGEANAFAGHALDANKGLSELNYNAATEDYNNQQLEQQRKRQAAAAKNHAIGQTVGAVGGGVAGGIFGGPMGAAAGSSAGGALGGGLSDATGPGYWTGGKVPGKAPVPGDSPANDSVPTMVSPGEVIVPRSVVEQHAKQHDAIGGLLDAVAKLHKARR